MQNTNIDYLKSQLKYTGFGESLFEQLETALRKQTPEFTLQHSSRFGKDQLTSSLYFKTGQQSGLYHFHSYLASLHNHGSDQMLNQRFFVGNNGNITHKEAFNLLQGRAVEKQLLDRTGQQYRAWLQLDFGQTDPSGNFHLRKFHQNYGYDLSGQLSKLPIKELENPDSAARLLDSLRRGNRQIVTLLDSGAEQKIFIEASPQFKAIIAYDQHAARRQIREATQASDLTKTASLNSLARSPSHSRGIDIS